MAKTWRPLVVLFLRRDMGHLVLSLIQDPSGHGPDEYPRLIAYTGFVGIWRLHFLAYIEFRLAILHVFLRTEFVRLCD